MKKNISIKDVAELAGVSPTTVSRVINNSDHPVNSKTREAVRKAIEELNYQPNRMARGLIKNESRLIGVIVHDISDAYFAEMVKGIEEVTFDYDYTVNINSTERNVHKELQAVNMLKANQADAVVFAGSYLLDDYYKREISHQIESLSQRKCVTISVTSHPHAIKNIEIGNQLAARMITEYLINRGHRQLAYISGPPILKTTQDRLNGFREALAGRGIDIREELIFSGDFTFRGGRQAALKLLKYIPGLTGIVAANDLTALGLMWELKQKGIDIPKDVSVVGIGNIPGSKYSYPPLTTVALPLYKLGKQIGNYIIGKLSSDVIPDIDVNIGLIERESVSEI